MNSIEPDQWAVTPYSSIREKKQVSITDIKHTLENKMKIFLFSLLFLISFYFDKYSLGKCGDMKENYTMKTKSIQEFPNTPSSGSMKLSD